MVKRMMVLAVVMLVAGACGGGSGLPGGLEGTWRDAADEYPQDVRIEGDRIYCLEKGTDTVMDEGRRTNGFEIVGVSEDGTRGTFRAESNYTLTRERRPEAMNELLSDCFTGEHAVDLDGDQMSLTNAQTGEVERWLRS